jgi:hypothetical protein
MEKDTPCETAKRLALIVVVAACSLGLAPRRARKPAERTDYCRIIFIEWDIEVRWNSLPDYRNPLEN